MNVNQRRAATFVMPVPDGVIDSYDRRQVAYVYPFTPPDAYVSLTASMNFSGSISAQNPNWLLLDDTLAWQGEWDATTTYELNDAVLYKTGNGDEFHVFVSKTSHNTGNNPTSSPAYWRRYYQEQFV